MKRKIWASLPIFAISAAIVIVQNGCSKTGFRSDTFTSLGAPIGSSAERTPAEVALAEKGKVFYANNCSVCHMEMANSSIRGRDDLQISSALQNVQPMSFLKTKVTADDIRALVAALAIPTSPAPTPDVACTPTALGKTTLRRMNFREFFNSTTDLLGAHTLAAADFPADTRGSSGFDTEGNALRTLGPDTEKIVAAAEKVVDQVLANSSSKFNSCDSGSKLVCASAIESQSTSLDCPAGQVISSIAFSSYGSPNGSCGSSTLGSCNSSSSRSVVEAACLGKASCNLSASNAVFGDPCAGATKQLFVEATCASPQAPNVVDRQSCLQNLLLTTARKAFRVPVTATEIKPLVDFAMAGPTAKEGMRDALVAMISAPKFLFHYINYSASQNGLVHSLSPYELAASLSFFLWSSIPDDTLNGLANSGAILNVDVQKQQVERMLKDPRGKSFLKSFASQWLGYQSVATAVRSPALHPEFNAALKTSMLNEAEMLFSDVIQRNLSADAILTANYAFVDRPLASFYGLSFPNTNSTFTAVPLDGVNRRGILTQAALMTATSNNDFTNPIHRGVVLLNRIICQPVGQPPPGVPSLASIDPTLPMKDRLALHRSNKTCASCHQHIDPLGLAFENFGATGKWRDMENGQSVDSSGTTADGYSFKKPGELASWMASGDKFEKCLSQYLATYATGRTPASGEKCYSNKIVSEKQSPQGTSLNDLIQGIVTSDLFQKSLFQQ